MRADGRPLRRARQGFVIGELLVAVLLLAVAVSSLAALMYSVSHRPTGASAEAACVAADAARGKCVPPKPEAVALSNGVSKLPASGASKLLRSECANKSVAVERDCKDSLATAKSAEGTILKARIDSTSLALLPKKKAERERTDRGFIR